MAGLILTHLEAMPVAGETYEIEGLRVKVVKMTASKIQLVDIVVAAEEEEGKK